MAKVEEYIKDAELRQISLNTDFSVVMANDLIKGISDLKLNELKLLRTLIMQIKPHDTELHPYELSVQDLQKIAGTDNKKMYHYAQKMCINLLKAVVLIGDGNPRHKWEAFNWVSYCKYDNGKITIRLNDALKKHIVSLQAFYTKYKLEEIVRLKNTYAIHLLELLHMAFKTEFYGQKNDEVYIDIKTIRGATNTLNKYKDKNKFRERVIDSAIKELNNKLDYFITYREHKEGRVIVGYYFLVRQKWEVELENRAQAKQSKQLNFDSPEITTIDADFREI